MKKVVYTLLALCCLSLFCLMAVLGSYAQTTGVAISEFICPIAGAGMIFAGVAWFFSKQ